MARVSLLSHQIDAIVSDFIDTIIREQKIVSLHSINTLRAELQERARQGYLLFPANTWDIQTKIDVPAHNENIKYLKKDMLAFNQTILDMSNQIERIKRNSQITKRYYTSLIETANATIKSVYSTALSDDLVFVETFASLDNIDDTKTTAFVNSELQTVELKNATPKDIIQTEGIAEESILVKVTSPTLQNHYYLGERRSIFLSSDANRLTIVGITKSKENVTASMTLPVSPDRSLKNANNISVRVGNPKGMFARIYVSSNGIDYEATTTEDISPLQGVYRTTHDKGPIRLVRIDLTKSSEDAINNNNLRYNFVVEQVTLDTKMFSDSAVVVSKAIQKFIDDEPVEIGSVKLEVDDFIPPECKIKYEVSTDSESWRPIVPINKEKALNNEVILKASTTYTSDDITPLNGHIWNDVSPVERKGIASLYNILSTGTADKNHDYGKIVTNADTGNQINVLSVPSARILPDTVTLRRGKGDWAAKSLNEGVTANVRRIDLVFKQSKRFDTKVPLRIIEERRQSDINGVIQTRFPILIDMDVLVVQDGKKIDVDNVTVSNLTISGFANQTVLVTYFTGLSDYATTTGWSIKLISESIVILDPVNDTVVARSNFEIDHVSMRVKLKPGAKLSVDTLATDSVNLRISFDYIIVENKDSLVYETYVEVSQPTTIRIFPLTTEEVEEFGNFHSVDGTDASYSTSFVLQPGAHKILSTNPHKTDPSNPRDVNLLSKKPSKAGVELKLENIKSMYGYELPQRRMNTFNLANTVRIGDDRSFSVEIVNGRDAMILLNRKPEEIPERLLADITTNHLRGVKLMCKRATYDSTGNFLAYVSIPETFSVTFQTLLDSSIVIDKMYYRATLSRSLGNSGQTPFINTVRVKIIRG